LESSGSPCRAAYTFIVMAVLILIFGRRRRCARRTDIFRTSTSRHQRGVRYTACLPTIMAGRIVTFYERSLPTASTTSSISKSQSIVNYGIIKIFFFFNPREHQRRVGAGQRHVADRALGRCRGHYPPLILSFNGSSVPILQLALSSDGCPKPRSSIRH